MNTRPRFVAAALAVTVTASLSLSLSPAPSTAAPPAAHTGLAPATDRAPARAPALHVRATVWKHHITSSRTGFRPGYTMFDLRTRGGTAAVQLLRLRHGYTLREFRRDIGSESLGAVRRIDRKVAFYGGMPVSRRGASHFGAWLDPGRYFLWDFDHPRLGRLRVQGGPERRSLPRTTGSVDMVMVHGKHRFHTPRRLPRSGWLRQKNRTDEPHFMAMIKVKRSTTRKQVRDAFAGKGPENPAWLLREYPGTFVVSPGRTVVWRYSYPRGKYLEVCFWPSDEDGTPHAEMGMWNFVTMY